MPKYKFNEEAAKLGLPVFANDDGRAIAPYPVENDISVKDFKALLNGEVHHATNLIPYDPSKHPITLKVVKEDGEQVWPYDVGAYYNGAAQEEYKVIYAFNSLDRKEKRFRLGTLFTKFDLEAKS